MDTMTQLVLNRLESEKSSLAERTAEVIAREIPAYKRVPKGALLCAIRGDLVALATTLRKGIPSVQDVGQGGLALARGRIRAGVSLTAYLESFVVGLRVAREWLEETGLQPSHQQQLERLVTDWVGIMIVRSAQDYLQVSKGHNEAANYRASLLRALLSGDSDPDVLKRAMTFGLRPDGDYCAFAAVRTTKGDLWSLVGEIAKSGSVGYELALVAELDERLVGIIAKPPSLSEPNAILALGPQLPLMHISQSFVEAIRVLNAAMFARRTGIVRLGDVAFQSAMLEDPARSQALVARYVTPIVSGDKGPEAVLDTVRLWLEHGGDSHEVAQQLGTHPNTVRYRLQIYQDRIGQELSTLEARAQAWWALCWYRAHRDDCF